MGRGADGGADRATGGQVGQGAERRVGGDEDIARVVIGAGHREPAGVALGDQLEAHVEVAVLEHDRIDLGDVLDGDLGLDHVALGSSSSARGDGVGDGRGHLPVGIALVDAVAQLGFIEPAADVPLPLGEGHVVEFRLLRGGRAERRHEHRGEQRKGRQQADETQESGSNAHDGISP